MNDEVFLFVSQTSPLWSVRRVTAGSEACVMRTDTWERAGVTDPKTKTPSRPVKGLMVDAHVSPSTHIIQQVHINSF